MSKLSEIVKTTFIKELGDKKPKAKYTFTELSIQDHIDIEEEYPSFDGDLLKLMQDAETSTFKVVTLVLHLMLKHEHEDIEKEDILVLPARILPELYREVLIGIYGEEENAQAAEKKTVEETETETEPTGSS